MFFDRYEIHIQIFWLKFSVQLSNSKKGCPGGWVGGKCKPRCGAWVGERGMEGSVVGGWVCGTHCDCFHLVTAAHACSCATTLGNTWICTLQKQQSISSLVLVTLLIYNAKSTLKILTIVNTNTKSVVRPAALKGKWTMATPEITCWPKIPRRIGEAFSFNRQR